MREIQIHIREEEKSEAGLTLFNFREELVNFMYKKTVADSSRGSMRFYILIFFLSIKVNSKTLLEDLLEKNRKKLEALNHSFDKKEKLRKNEYTKFVEDAGLTKIFRNDVFFLLMSSILDSANTLRKFADFFEHNKEERKDFVSIVEKYGAFLRTFDENFRLHRIADDRTDDLGNYHDLSKSVYRTIQMRTSRQLDLTLHKYADLKKVKSESPIDLTILQHIDPHIIIHLWEVYGIGDYTKGLWNVAADFGVQGAVGLGAFQYVARKYAKWKSINGNKDRKGKKAAKEEFERALKTAKKDKKIIGLTEVLVQSVLKSNEYLKKEILALKEQMQELAKSRTVMNKKDVDKKIRELDKKVDRLENIHVKAREKRKKKSPKKR